MNRTTNVMLALSCAALVAVISNCGSTSPVATGTAGATGSAGATTGAAGATTGAAGDTTGAAGESTGAAGETTGGGTAGETTTGAAGETGGGTAGATTGTAGTTGAAGATGAAGRNGDAGTVVCREATMCGATGDTCSTDCTRGQQTSCACFDPTGTRLEWACVNHACATTTDGGAGAGGGTDGGNTGAAGRDGGITIVDGGVVFPVCPANVTMNTTVCDRATEAACATACTNNAERTCFCGRNNRWTCTATHRCTQ